MMAFIGVRISWLIVARKVLLASAAASAATRRRAFSSAVRRCVSAISRIVPSRNADTYVATVTPIIGTTHRTTNSSLPGATATATP